MSDHGWSTEPATPLALSSATGYPEGDDGNLVQLLMRTTHQLSLTGDGRMFLEDARRMLSDWQQNAEALGGAASELSINRAQ